MNLDRAMDHIRNALAHLPHVSNRTLRLFFDACERLATLIQLEAIMVRSRFYA